MKKINVEFVHGKFGIWHIDTTTIEAFPYNLKDFRTNDIIMRKVRNSLCWNPDEIILLKYEEYKQPVDIEYLLKQTFRNLNSIDNIKNSHGRKMTLDFETGVFYDSRSDACEALNINYDKVNYNNKVGIYHRLMDVDTEESTEKSLNVVKGFKRFWYQNITGLGGRNNKMVLDLETGIFFHSATEAIDSLNMGNFDWEKLGKNKHKRLSYIGKI